jgi:hypothetical protein
VRIGHGAVAVVGVGPPSPPGFLAQNIDSVRFSFVPIAAPERKYGDSGFARMTTVMMQVSGLFLSCLSMTDCGSQRAIYFFQ